MSRFRRTLRSRSAELVASRIMEIDGMVVALIRERMGRGKLDRETVRMAQDESAQSVVTAFHYSLSNFRPERNMTLLASGGAMKERVAAIFSNLDRWRHLPNYQLERRTDIFFSVYLKQLVEEFTGAELLDIIIPELPIDTRIRVIYLQPAKTCASEPGASGVRREECIDFDFIIKRLKQPHYNDGFSTIFAAHLERWKQAAGDTEPKR